MTAFLFTLQEKINELRDRLSVALGYKSLRPQQVDPRRTSIQSQRGLNAGTPNRQAPYFYSQTVSVIL